MLFRVRLLNSMNHGHLFLPRNQNVSRLVGTNEVRELRNRIIVAPQFQVMENAHRAHFGRVIFLPLSQVICCLAPMPGVDLFCERLTEKGLDCYIFFVKRLWTFVIKIKEYLNRAWAKHRQEFEAFHAGGESAVPIMIWTPDMNNKQNKSPANSINREPCSLLLRQRRQDGWNLRRQVKCEPR